MVFIIFMPLELCSIATIQWCSKTTKLQDHLFFQDQDQNHFFKTKTTFSRLRLHFF